MDVPEHLAQALEVGGHGGLRNGGGERHAWPDGAPAPTSGQTYCSSARLCPAAARATLDELLSALSAVNDHNAPFIASRLYERLRFKSGLDPSCLSVTPSAARLAVSALYACRLARAAGTLQANHCPAGELVSNLAPSEGLPPDAVADAGVAALQLWALETSPDLAGDDQLESVVEATLDTTPWGQVELAAKRRLAGFVRAELEGDTATTITIAGELEPALMLEDSAMSAWGALLAALDDRADDAIKELKLLEGWANRSHRFGVGVALSFIAGAQWTDVNRSGGDRLAMAPFAAPVGLAYQRPWFWWMPSLLDPAQYLNQSIAATRKAKPLDLIAPSMTVALAPPGWSRFFVGASGGATRVVYKDVGAYVGGVVGVGWVPFPFSADD